MSTKHLMIFFFLIQLCAVKTNGKYSTRCGPNAVFICNKGTIFPHCKWQTTCHIRVCGGLCLCKEGYVKNSDGKCIPRECPRRSSFRSCTVPGGHRFIGALQMDVNRPCKSGCECDPGYYWFGEIYGCLSFEEFLQLYYRLSIPRFG